MPAARSRKGKGRAEPYNPTAELPLGKQLAHTDKNVRDQAVANLVAFLSRGSYVGSERNDDVANGTNGQGSGYAELDEAEIDKLWKGLFYCFWMSDKPLIQQALAADLAELLLLIQPKDEAERFRAALAFLAGFWRAIVREWQGIDRLRMDKFYLLLRRYTNATFRLLARENWSLESIRQVTAILTEGMGPISWKEKSVPSSIATHLADVYLDELDNVLSRPEVTAHTHCPLIRLLQPHIDLLAHTSTPSVHSRLVSTLFQPLLDALNAASPDPEEDHRPTKRKKDEPTYAHIVMGCSASADSTQTESTSGIGDGESRGRAHQLKHGLLRAMFDAASKEDALEVNRRKIYKLWKEEGGDDD